MNSLLVENAIYFGENFILPKSSCLCVIRYLEDEGMVRGSEEMQHMEHGVMIVEACAREEREEGARGEDHQENQAEEFQTGLSGLVRPDYPAPGESTSFSRSCTLSVVVPDICNNPARTIRPGVSGFPGRSTRRSRDAHPRWSDRHRPRQVRRRRGGRSRHERKGACSRLSLLVNTG